MKTISSFAISWWRKSLREGVNIYQYIKNENLQVAADLPRLCIYTSKQYCYLLWYIRVCGIWSRGCRPRCRWPTYVSVWSPLPRLMLWVLWYTLELPVTGQWMPVMPQPTTTRFDDRHTVNTGRELQTGGLGRPCRCRTWWCIHRARETRFTSTNHVRTPGVKPRHK